MHLARTSFGAACVVVAFAVGPAHAKLPPLSDEAKAKAAETAARTAWTGKVNAYKLCQSMDRTVEHYRKTQQGAGKPVPAPVATPPCTDPGPFVPPPLEASGAHSPSNTATAPPSSKQTAAETQGTAKK